jgi:hypothetical protein
MSKVFALEKPAALSCASESGAARIVRVLGHDG